MKILCCSDTHGQAPPAPDGVDVVFHAGDFYNRLGPAGKPKGIPYNQYIGMVNKKDELSDWKSSLQQPFFWVKGNHDVEDPYDLLKGADASGVQEFNGLLLVGIGWSGDVFFQLPDGWIISEACKNVRRQIAKYDLSKYKVVMLTHYPPYWGKLYNFNGNPEGWMFEEIACLCEEIKPKVVIQGHVHELFGKIVNWNDSLIVVPGPRGMILDMSGSEPIVSSN